MGNYRDLNTGQEYDNIPEGKVQPYIVNGQIGWTWYGRPGFGDAAVETVPAFKLAMEKKGGKLDSNK